MVGRGMSRPDPRRPVQPWIPQRPQQPQPRTVYVRERPADGGKALRAGWVLNGVLLGMTVVLLVALALITRHAARGGEVEPVALMATLGWWAVALIVIGVVDLALLVLGIVAMAQGAALRGLALLVVSLINGLVCWLGLTYGAGLVILWVDKQFSPPAMQAPIKGEERKIGGGFSPLPR
jgi:hypothetical protein